MKQQQEPKIKKGDKTRQRILDAALALMAEKGPDAVSMREISAKLKITKPVLYYYYKDKDELIKATFLEGTKHFNEVHQVISDPGMPLEKKLEAVFANHLAFIRRYPDMPKCALKLMASPSGGVLSNMSKDLKNRNRAAMRAMLEKEKLPRQGAENVIHMTSAVIGYFIIEARERGVASLGKDLPGRLARLIVAGARSMKALALALALPALLAGSALAAPLELSVDGAVQTALKNNVTVLNAEESRRIYKERVDEYYGTLFPQISASAQYTSYLQKPNVALLGNKPDNLYTGSLDASQVLWAGGKVYTGIKIASLYSKAGDEQLKTAQNGITRGVKQMYYYVLLARALAGIQEESLGLSREHLATIEAQYKQGIASDLAVLRQQVEVSNSQPALTQARNLYEEGLVDLKNLLGLDPEAEIALSGELACQPAAPGEITTLYAKAMAARPEYKTAKHQLDMAEQLVKVERAGHFPYLSAFASRQYYGATDGTFPASGDRTWTTLAGLRLSLPLFAGGSVNSRVNQAEMQANIARNNLAELERKIKIEVKKAWLSMAEASERVASQTTAVAQARKALSATEVRFKNGLAGQLDLSDATLALNRAQTLYTQARHDLCSAQAVLEWTAGN
jgi:outer membrane protein